MKLGVRATAVLVATLGASIALPRQAEGQAPDPLPLRIEVPEGCTAPATQVAALTAVSALPVRLATTTDATVELVVVIAASGERWRATIERTTPGHRFVRTVESETSQCASLDDGVRLVLALALDGWTSGAPPPQVPRDVPRPPTPPAAPTLSSPPTLPAAPTLSSHPTQPAAPTLSSPPTPSPHADEAHPAAVSSEPGPDTQPARQATRVDEHSIAPAARLLLGLGVTTSTSLARPLSAVGVRLDAIAVWGRLLRLAFGAEAGLPWMLGPTPAGATANVTAAGVFVGWCPVIVEGAVGGVEACGHFELGLARAAPSNVVGPVTTWSPWVEGRVSGLGFVRVSERFDAGAGLAMGILALQPRLVVESSGVTTALADPALLTFEALVQVRAKLF